MFFIFPLDYDFSSSFFMGAGGDLAPGIMRYYILEIILIVASSKKFSNIFSKQT